MHEQDFRQECAVCDAMQQMTKDGEDEDEISSLKPNKRVLVWILDRDEEALGPQLYAMPWTLDRDIAKLSKDKRTGAIYYIDDPVDGYDIMFEKTGEQLKTKYVGIALARQSTSVAKKHLAFIEDNPLDTVIIERKYAEIKKILTGGIDVDDVRHAERSAGKPSRPRRDEDEEDEPKPARRRARDAVDDDEVPFEGGTRAAGRRTRVEEEEDDTPPPRRRARAEPEEDEAPAPRRRATIREPEAEDDPSPRRRARAEPEDEEDEPKPARRRARAEPEEDEEEEAPPRRASRRGEPEEDEDEDAARAALRKKLAERNRR